MTTSFRVRVCRQLPYGVFFPYGSVQELTAEVLRSVIQGALVQAIVGTPDDGYSFDIVLPRSDPAAALEDLSGQLMSLGYTITDVLVSDWVARSTEVGITCALAGGGGSGALTKNPVVAVLVGVGSYLVGRAAGRFVHEEIARYRASRDPFWGTWQVTPVELPQTRQYRVGYA